MFKSCYINKPVRKPTSSGFPYSDEMAYVINEETGSRELKVVGKVNNYERTQLARPDDLYTLLKKCGVSPESVESLRVTKEYVDTLIDDFSKAPRTLIEAHNVIHRAQDSFMDLPLDVRAEFNNDPGQMLSSVVDGSFEKRVSRFYEKRSEVKDEQTAK